MPCYETRMVSIDLSSVKDLDALASIPHITPRPVAIAVGCVEGSGDVENLEILRKEGGCPLIPAAHNETVQRATKWITEHLK